MPSPSLNPVDVHDFAGQIPASFIASYDRIRAAEEARYEQVHTTLWGSAQSLLTNFGAGAIVLNSAGLDQTARLQAALNASAAGNFPIDGTALSGFIEMGTAASRIHEFALGTNAISIAANPNPLIDNSTVTVSHTANGTFVGENVYFATEPGEVLREPIEIGGIDLVIRSPHVVTVASANSYQFVITGRATPSPSVGGTGVLATYRAPFVSLVPPPGAMLVLPEGDQLKLWRKSGNNTGFEAGAGAYLFTAALAHNFWLEGGAFGIFGDSVFHRGGHTFGVSGDGVFFRNNLIDKPHGIQAFQSGNDSGIRGLKSINTDPEAGGGIRISGSETGYLCEDFDILTSDDALMNSGSIGNGKDVMFVNGRAIGQQGAMCVSIVSRKQTPTGVNAFITSEGRTVWDRVRRTLFAGVSGRSGQDININRVQGAYGIKGINHNFREVAMWFVGTPFDRSRDMTGRALRHLPGRGPVHLTFIESPVTQPLREAFASEPGIDNVTGEETYDSTSVISFTNSNLDAPREAGHPTIRVLGAQLLRMINTEVLTNNGDAIDVSSDIGTTQSVTLSGASLLELGTKRSGVNARRVTEVRVRGTHFIAAPGATSVNAVKRATSDTNVIAGLGRRNTFTGVTELFTGHGYVNDETDNLLKRFVDLPSTPALDVYDETMTMLKASAAYSLLDFFYLFPGESLQGVCQNWIADKYNCTEVGETILGGEDGEDILLGPEFVRYQGVRGIEGTPPRYLNSNFIPIREAAAGSRWQQTSATLFLWSGEDLVGGNDRDEVVATQSGGSFINVHRVDGTTRVRLNDSTNTLFAGPPTPNDQGPWFLRRGSSTINLRHNSTNIGFATVPSTVMTDNAIRVAHNNRLLKAVGGGAYLGDATCDELTAVMQFFIDGMAALIPVEE
jgi:hypothetical protein